MFKNRNVYLMDFLYRSRFAPSQPATRITISDNNLNADLFLRSSDPSMPTTNSERRQDLNPPSQFCVFLFEFSTIFFFFFMRFMEKLYQFTRCGSLLSSNFMSLFDYFLFYLFSQNPFFTCSFTLFSSLCQICVLLSCKEICEEKYGYKQIRRERTKHQKS